MADQLKIHPVQASPPPKPSAPLIDNSRYAPSENGDPERQQNYYTQTPVTTGERNKRCCSCKRCCCWSLALLILIVLVLGALAAVIYFVFNPQIPGYSIDDLRIAQFSIGTNTSLSVTFDVNITAINPNRRIGIYYEDGSNLSVLYTGTELCRGSLPVFYQGYRNTTYMRVALTGETDDATGLLQSLQLQQQIGNIPLDLIGRVPVKLRLGSLNLTTWRFSVRCRLIVDSLSAVNTIRIRERSCSIRFRL